MVFRIEISDIDTLLFSPTGLPVQQIEVTNLIKELSKQEFVNIIGTINGKDECVIKYDEKRDEFMKGKLGSL